MSCSTHGRKLGRKTPHRQLDAHGAFIMGILTAVQAHWFGAKFWPQAAKLLRPGGTVVLWITSLYYPRKPRFDSEHCLHLQNALVKRNG